MLLLFILNILFAFISIVVFAYLIDVQEKLEYQEQNNFYDGYTKKLLEKEEHFSKLLLIFSSLTVFCGANCAIFELFIR